MNNNTVFQYQQETNERIYSRNIPSQPLQPYIDFRPCMSKYTYLPIVEPKTPRHPLKQYPVYNTEKVFNPGNTQSPYSGFAANINIESELRDQIFALQKCSKSVYVPSSSSDLYQNNQIYVKNSGSYDKGKIDLHNLLFKEEKFCPFNPNPDNEIIGTQIWYNPSRVQIQEYGDLLSSQNAK